MSARTASTPGIGIRTILVHAGRDHGHIRTVVGFFRSFVIFGALVTIGRRQWGVRLFVAVWPPLEVIELVSGLYRPEAPRLRWTARPQWHVTLQFLGDVAEPEGVAEVGEALDGLSGTGSAHAVVGPSTAWFPGHKVLQVPVAGLEDLARRVQRAISSVGQVLPPARGTEPPFRGHLTVARVRPKGRIGTELARQLEGSLISAEWDVESVSLVASRLRSAGPVYSDVKTVALDY
jgi:RNA 2',3'-cyclic 3'-phosphodiesterase